MTQRELSGLIANWLRRPWWGLAVEPRLGDQPISIPRRLRLGLWALGQDHVLAERAHLGPLLSPQVRDTGPRVSPCRMTAAWLLVIGSSLQASETQDGKGLR